MKYKFVSGALPDTRDDNAKMRDYRIEELATAPIIEWVDFETWKQKNKNLLDQMKIHNQNGAGSCVGNSIANALSIINYYEEGKFLYFSPRLYYANRSNKPQPGMNIDDAGKLPVKLGAIFESELPSDLKSEEEMNRLDDMVKSYETIGKIYAPGSFFHLPFTIDKFAEAIANYKAVVMFVKFGDGEWGVDVPQIKTINPQYGHGVCSFSYCMYQGKKSLVIVDSWGVDNPLKGLRILTEDWFNNNRIFGAITYVDLKNKEFTEETVLPKYTFNRDLYYGLTRDPDVKKLQEVLYLMGYFNYDTFTGNYYGLTVDAVMKFQLANGIIKSKTDEGAGRCGPLTRSVLNKMLNK